MLYSKDLPNTEGWYFLETPSGYETIKRVFINGNDDLCVHGTDINGNDRAFPVENFKKSKWSGPIQSPTNKKRCSHDVQ